MGIGAGVGLLAAGAVLTWAVDVDLPGVDDDALGAILIVLGVVMLVVSVVLNAHRSHQGSDVGWGLALLAAGAILCWAVDVDLPYIVDQALGAILMVGGAVAIGASLFMHRQRTHTRHVVERRGPEATWRS